MCSLSDSTGHMFSYPCNGVEETTFLTTGFALDVFSIPITEISKTFPYTFASERASRWHVTRIPIEKSRHHLMAFFTHTAAFHPLYFYNTFEEFGHTYVRIRTSYECKTFCRIFHETFHILGSNTHFFYELHKFTHRHLGYFSIG